MDANYDETSDVFTPVQMWLIKVQRLLINTFREKRAYC